MPLLSRNSAVSPEAHNNFRDSPAELAREGARRMRPCFRPPCPVRMRLQHSPKHRRYRDGAEIFTLESAMPDFLICCKLVPSAVRHDVIAWRSRIANLAMHNSSILITGGTGSFGSKFVPMALRRHDPVRIVIYSRDEMKQWEMAKAYADDSRVRFFLGDVRDKSRLCRAMDGIDYVVHAAALKIIPIAEYNPFECVKTNIKGAMNIVDACLDVGVKKCIALSTDKASSPVNLYGATKLASEKLIIAANSYSGTSGCRFSIVRYGNVMGSRGSVIPYFLSLGKGEEVPITDVRMTRFMIKLEQAVDLVFDAFSDMSGGEVYVHKVPSMKVVDIAKACAPNASHKIIGIRPGEKLNEQLIAEEEAPFTFEHDCYYKIMPSIRAPSDPADLSGAAVDANFKYTSDLNRSWMTVEELSRWIRENPDLPEACD